MTERENAARSLPILVSEFDEEATNALVRERLAAGEDPMLLLEECEAGVKLIGRMYEEGVYFISALIMAGELMRGVLEIVTPEIRQKDPNGRTGAMLICTVQGDIHDVGKNIATTLLQAHGIEVVDLGVDVPPARVVEAVTTMRPDIVGLSGLLTEALGSMQRTVAAIRESTADWEVHVPIILGGSLMNQKVCDRVGADWWCDDAVEGANLVCKILEERRATA